MAGNKESLDEWAAQFGIKPSKPPAQQPKKPSGLRADVETPAEKAAREKKKKDKRTLRQKMRDRRKILDEI
jgi:hypothetical protein